MSAMSYVSPVTEGCCVMSAMSYVSLVTEGYCVMSAMSYVSLVTEGYCCLLTVVTLRGQPKIKFAATLFIFYFYLV